MKLSFAQKFLNQSTANLLLNLWSSELTCKQAIEEPEQHSPSFHRTEGQRSSWPKARSSRSQLPEQFLLSFSFSTALGITGGRENPVCCQRRVSSNTVTIRTQCCWDFFCFFCCCCCFYVVFFLMPRAGSKSMCFHFALMFHMLPLHPPPLPLKTKGG